MHCRASCFPLLLGIDALRCQPRSNPHNACGRQCLLRAINRTLSPSSSASSEGVPSCALTRSSSELLCGRWRGAALSPAAACCSTPAGDAKPGGAKAGDADPGEGVQRCGCRGCVCSCVPCWITSSRLVPCASELLSCSDALRLEPLPCAWPPAWPQRGLDIAIGTIAKFRWGVHLRQAESGLVQDLERHSQITH